MKHALGAAAVGAMLASLKIGTLLEEGSYDRVVLLVCVGLQLALLASLYLPLLPDSARSGLASFSHFGFVTGVVYGAVASSRPTLILTIVLLLTTILSRLVVRGCMYSIAEHPGARRVEERASWSSDWQLLGVLLLGVMRLCSRWTPRPSVQALLAFVCSVGAAYSWA